MDSWDALNIRVYRATRITANEIFQCKTADTPGAVTADTLDMIAQEVVGTIRAFAKSPERYGRLSNVSIDFTPYHAIDCGGIPKRCVDLSGKEQDDFWNAFQKWWAQS